MVQYWFYYAYSSFWIPSFDHEGEWEMIQLELDSDREAVRAWYSAHGKVEEKYPEFRGDHPVVYSGLGTHASFHTQCGLPERCAAVTCDSCRWFTWDGGLAEFGGAGKQGGGVVNLGELDAPMSGKSWLKYSGRWGEIGNAGTTSGPRGPAFQPPWFDGCDADRGGACEGPDGDQCGEGTTRCDGSCTDTSGTTVEVCGNAIDEDCDGDDLPCPTGGGGCVVNNGADCDGLDGDSCFEGKIQCDGSCSDNTGTTSEVCGNGLDEDCRNGDASCGCVPNHNQPCDGFDYDQCNEGTTLCDGTCSDTSGTNTEICGNSFDDDCIGGDLPCCVAYQGQSCDGTDGDWCHEGVYTCDGTCTDSTGTNLETCNGQDDDCDWNVDEGGVCQPSCSGNCGGSAGSCFCDSACVSMGDCCSDYDLYCG
jgi:hypothetical protein